MRSVKEACKPRKEVARGELTRDLFAAQLDLVLRGEAPAIYNDPREFFGHTYPTERMKVIFRRVLKRLKGEAEATTPIIRLETSLGGGKTHTLIALYHLARHGAIPGAEQFVDFQLLPEEDVAVAAVDGRQLDPEQGIRHGEVTTYTLWGEIAYQLGGREAYDLLASSDRSGVPPGSETLRDIIGEKPTLIMIDELARHYRTAKAKALQEGSLASQLSPFLHGLLAAVKAQPRAVIVFSLTEEDDPYGEESELLRQHLQEIRESLDLSRREERIEVPIEEHEVPNILRRRLFESVSKTAGEQVVETYFDYYRRAEDRDFSLPVDTTRASFRERLVEDYPFHPDLLDLFSNRLASLPRFQQTRDFLRLMARVIRNIFERAEDAYLIHPYHLDLSLEEIRDSLTSGLGKQGFTAPIRSDIYNRDGNAFAQRFDRNWEERAEPPLASRVATTVFLHSLVEVRSGIDETQLYREIGEPGVSLDSVKQALEQLRDSAHFIEWEEDRHRFKREPSLNRIIAQERDNVSLGQAKDWVRKKVGSLFRNASFHVDLFPDHPADIADDPDEWHLVIPDFDHIAVDHSRDIPDTLVDMYEYSGTRRTHRSFKNHMVFLVASRTHLDNLWSTVRTRAALNVVRTSPHLLEDLTQDQQRVLEERWTEAQVEARGAIARAYRVLVYPAGDDLKDHPSGLTVAELSPETQGREMEHPLPQVLEEELRHRGKLEAPDTSWAPQYLKDQAWRDRNEISTGELQERFARRRSLPILPSLQPLQSSIERGIRQNWVYVDSDDSVYGPESENMPPLVKISNDCYLYTKTRAEELDIYPEDEDPEGNGPEPDPCPICGSIPCVCETPLELDFSQEGPISLAFSSLETWAEDQEIDRLEELSVTMGGVQAVRTVKAALPTIPKDGLTVEHFLAVEAEGNRVKLEFTGGPEWTRRLLGAGEYALSEVRDSDPPPTGEVTLRYSATDGFSPSGQLVERLRQRLDTYHQSGSVKLTARGARN